METSKIQREDVEKAYAFLHDKKLFEPTGTISRKSVGAAIDALRELGDLPADFKVDSLLLPGVAQISQ
jgi:hypothetical protein